MGMDYKELIHLCESKGTEQACEWLGDAIADGDIKLHEFSLREAFIDIVGWEAFQSLKPKSGRTFNLQEASGTAVSFDQFSKITGQIMFSSILQGFDRPEFVFSKAIPNKPTPLQDRELIPGISEIGDEMQVVEEGDEFPFAGVSQDYIEVAQKTKRGAIVRVTKEAVEGDKTSVLVERLGGLGYWLGLNKEKRCIDAVIDENTGATSIVNRGHRFHWLGNSHASFQASSPWVNIKTSNGLATYANLAASWLLFQNMTDPWTGEPIFIEPRDIIVTPQNYHAAQFILHSTEVRTNTNAAAGTPTVQTHGPSPIGPYRVLWSALLAARAATDTDWWHGDVGKAVNYYQNWDITPEELGRSAEEAFKRDIIMQFKASEKGHAQVVQPRALVENQA